MWVFFSNLRVAANIFLPPAGVGPNDSVCRQPPGHQVQLSSVPGRSTTVRLIRPAGDDWVIDTDSQVDAGPQRRSGCPGTQITQWSKIADQQRQPRPGQAPPAAPLQLSSSCASFPAPLHVRVKRAAVQSLDFTTAVDAVRPPPAANEHPRPAPATGDGRRKAVRPNIRISRSRNYHQRYCATNRVSILVSG